MPHLHGHRGLQSQEYHGGLRLRCHHMPPYGPSCAAFSVPALATHWQSLCLPRLAHGPHCLFKDLCEGGVQRCGAPCGLSRDREAAVRWTRSLTSLPWPPHGAQQIWTEESQGHMQTGRGTTAVTRTLDPPTGRRRLPSRSWQQAAGGPSARAGGRQPEPSARPRAAFSSCSWPASGSRPGTAALPSLVGTLPPAGQVRPEGVLWAWPALGPLGLFSLLPLTGPAGRLRVSQHPKHRNLAAGCGTPCALGTHLWLRLPDTCWGRFHSWDQASPVRGPARGGGARWRGAGPSTMGGAKGGGAGQNRGEGIGIAKLSHNQCGETRGRSCC